MGPRDQHSIEMYIVPDTVDCFSNPQKFSIYETMKQRCQISSRSGIVLAPLGMLKLMIGQDFPIANPLPWMSIEGREGIPCRVYATLYPNK